MVWPRLLAVCTTLLVVGTVRADDWPKWRGPTGDGQWRETGIVDRLPEGRIPLRWRTPISSGYSGPTVSEGRVFITDRVAEPQQIERVHCLDEGTGKPLWRFDYRCDYTISYTAGPRASVTIDQGRAYALGAMGHLHCFDCSSGEVVWKRDLNSDYKIEGDGRSESRMPIWGIAAAPLVHEDLLIVIVGGADGAGVVAFDKHSGEERWKSLDDRAQYSAPIVIEQAGRSVVVCWTADSVTGLDPESGKTFWRVPFEPSRMPIGIATPVVSRNRLLVTSFYDGAMMLELRQDAPAVRELWRKRGRDERRTEALHSIISTPLFLGDLIYGVDSYGELRCLDSDGERLWENLTATPKARWSTIHFVQQGERTWMFNERGELIIARLSRRGYDEISRSQLIDPTSDQLNERGGVCWSHPAFANRCVFARNDQEIVCASLAASDAPGP